MKIKKQQRRKKYIHHLNRKRMNKTQNGTGAVLCKVMKDEWDHKRSTLHNLKQMGLANDPNKVIKIPNFKQDQLNKAKKMLKQDESESEEEQIVSPPTKINVLHKLEKEATAPKTRKFKLPKGQVEYITYLLDKYGHDYKAMTRDKKNYNQETWKQLRAKVKTFMGIPTQYGEYLKSRGLVNKEDEKKQVNTLVMDDSD